MLVVGAGQGLRLAATFWNTVDLDPVAKRHCVITALAVKGLSVLECNMLHITCCLLQIGIVGICAFFAPIGIGRIEYLAEGLLLRVGQLWEGVHVVLAVRGLEAARSVEDVSGGGEGLRVGWIGLQLMAV